MRFVSKEINRYLEDEPPAVNANFGLIFNKWLPYHRNREKIEPTVSQDRGPLVTAFKSVKKTAAEILKQHHIRQAKYCRAMEKAGWTSFIFHARLIAPFVSGLGASHPTETGLMLDHTSGMPYIPASGQKGVLRLAHMVNSLQDENGGWLEESFLRKQEIIDDQMNWMEDKESRTLFGSSSENDPLAGQLTILDAYPLQPPELGEEILTPHYSEYYQGKKNRGPTEDQSPVPVKFLVVKPGTEFVFRMLLRLSYSMVPLQNQTKLLSVLIEKNIKRALTKEGVGAKTALGFGRFQIISEGTEVSSVTSWLQEAKESQEPWLPYINSVKRVATWGDFKQVVLDADINPQWQSRQDVATAVKEAALQLYKQKPNKWDADRDRLVAEWLEVSAVKWSGKTIADTTAADNPLLAQIRGFTTPADYDRSLDLATLDRECCLTLLPVFKKWNWDKKKKAKTNNHKLWKVLQGRIEELKA